MTKTFNLNFDFLGKLHDMCLILSKDFEIISSNNVFLNLFNSEERNFLDTIDDSFKDSAQAQLKECYEKNISIYFNSKFKASSNSFYVNLFAAPISIKNKNKALFIIAKDISEQRQKDLKLLRFYNIAERSIFPLEVTDINGNIVYVNQAYLQASGFSKEEVMGKNPNIFGSGKHSKKFWKNMWDTVNSGKVWVDEVENRKKNGDPFHTQLMISPITDYNNKIIGFFGIHRDLSEKKFLEKQLVHTQKMESIGTLAAGIAHEVGNPLASISSLVQVMLRSENDASLREKLELIKDQVSRISKIIRNLVDFSRPSTYELKLTDVNELLYKSLNIVKVGKKAKDIEFKTDLNLKLPLVPLIPDQIEQVFLNILLNAVDAINEKEIKKNENIISLGSNIDDNHLTIKISDTGKGMTNKEIDKIFEPFYTTKKEGKGTGLGMWISYGIIKSFEGEIIVESKPGEGSTFLIKLPV